MTFADLTPGDAIFTDANTLIYHFSPHPVFGPPCNKLVEEVENQGLIGYCSTHVMAEVSHQLMIIEATALSGWVPGKVAQRLRKQPPVFQQLTHFQKATDSLLQSRFQVLSISPPLLATAAALSRQYGLLTNDAIVIALMQQNGLTRLASHDTDFDRVPGVTRYAPT